MFYADVISIVVPTTVRDGGRDLFDYATPKEVYPHPTRVDFQPITTTEQILGPGKAVVENLYRLHTRPGRALIAPVAHRVRYKGDDFELDGEVVEWSSAEHPSGIDHVEASYRKIGKRNGAKRS